MNFYEKNKFLTNFLQDSVRGAEAGGQPVVNTIHAVHNQHHHHPQHRSSTTETNLCRATYNNVSMTENEINRKRRRSLDDVVDSSVSAGLEHKRISSGTDRFGNLMNSTPIARDYSMDHHSSAHSSPFHQGMYLVQKSSADYEYLPIKIFKITCPFFYFSFFSGFTSTFGS